MLRIYFIKINRFLNHISLTYFLFCGIFCWFLVTNYQLRLILRSECLRGIQNLSRSLKCLWKKWCPKLGNLYNFFWCVWSFANAGRIIQMNGFQHSHCKYEPKLRHNLPSFSEFNKEQKHKTMWMAQTPYIVLNYKILDCQHGRDRHIAGKVKAQNKEVYEKRSSFYLIHVN